MESSNGYVRFMFLALSTFQLFSPSSSVAVVLYHVRDRNEGSTRDPLRPTLDIYDEVDIDGS